MAKAPSFPFYPSDYLRDTRVLSLAAKGAWSDLLCFMWGAQNRGSLTSTVVGYSRMIGATVEQTVAVLNEIIETGTCDAFADDTRQTRLVTIGGVPKEIEESSVTSSVTKTDNVTIGNGKVTLICRRMFRQENERKNTALRVQKFRERQCNATRNGTSNGAVTMTDTSSSSFSSNYTVTNTESTNVLSLPQQKKTSIAAIHPHWPAADTWLKNFLEQQASVPVSFTYLNDPAWWEEVSTVSGGLDLDFLTAEFSRMGAWLRENPQRAPAGQRGWKRFVRTWLERAHERARRYANGR